MFSCSNGGRLCVCGHIKAQHSRNDVPYCFDCQLDGVNKFTKTDP
jgi:hypothetical protein